MKLPRIPLPPDGQDFAELMALEKIGENTFKSASMPCPGGPRIFDGKLYISTFGGHVYAQAAWAAAQTVPDGFVIHNTSGYFVAAGLSKHAFQYTVTHLRAGKSFLTILVTVTQPTSPLSPDSCCFTATVSFKRPEPASSPTALNYQDPPLPNDGGPLTPVADLLRHGSDGDAHRPYPHPRSLPVKRFDDLAAVLAFRPPHAFRSPSVPGIWWALLPYDASPEQDGKKQKEWSSLRDARPAARMMANLYTVKGSVSGGGHGGRSRRRTGGGGQGTDSDSDSNSSDSSSRKWRHINLSICAHLYASDRESLYLVTRSLGVREAVMTGGARNALASISHSVVLHDLGDGVVFPDADDDLVVGDERERWFCQEVRTDRWADGRVLVHGRIFDVDTGRHVASTMQDGILKVDFGAEEEEAAERAREALGRGVGAEERERRPMEKAKM
ncbi:hypothetical protein DIS24_g10904 [Lasiodiplodia hormozganensis]|uniref:Acyl-CoA thioesterase-like N-terminal HotDog domain-containing protein n=1 Tax=Lasiodiplodia hormozganensis TaxID=869390 RepID=A0AA39X6F0_9PEZI|nr:hypothetical protein DIS24_g10904 [Lasiodiplodia hormozganensis]